LPKVFLLAEKLKSIEDGYFAQRREVGEERQGLRSEKTALSARKVLSEKTDEPPQVHPFSFYRNVDLWGSSGKRGLRERRS
jgi:hypothetical protein